MTSKRTTSQRANIGSELRRWRQHRGLSLRELGRIVHYEHSRLWKIEAGRSPISRDLAALCDTALDTGGALTATLGPAKPAQIPAAPILVGREDTLATLTSCLHDQPPGTPNVAAIDGPAGVGKTALALRWAHDIAERYADGQLYADLRGFAPDGHRDQVSVHEVLEEFLSALGAPAIPATLKQRIGLFRTMTANRNIMVILDNVASEEQIEPLVPASAGSLLIVTSRRALILVEGRLGATRATLPPLAELDAINLLQTLIGRTRTTAEPDAMKALARQCGHLPLALHAAADQLLAHPLRQILTLVDELEDGAHRLPYGDTTDVATVLSWSCRDLHPDTARLFRVLGAHDGTHLNVAAIAAMARVSVSSAWRQLQPLIMLHLVAVERDGIVRLPAPVRSYARNLANAGDGSGSVHVFQPSGRSAQACAVAHH